MRVMVLQYQHQYTGKLKETSVLDFRFRENVSHWLLFGLKNILTGIVVVVVGIYMSAFYSKRWH